MTETWLPGVLRLTASKDAGPQDTRYPPRLVLHTTEGFGTVRDLAGFYERSTYWPNFTADLDDHVLAQHIPLERAGRALSHTDQTQTNGANCIQVEIIGFSAAADKDYKRPDGTVIPAWKDADVEWLGAALAPVFSELDIPLHSAMFAVPAVRMSNALWTLFSGVCGHQHVPQNNHWDPGAMDSDAFLKGVGGGSSGQVVPPATTIVVEDDHMIQLEKSIKLGAQGEGYFDIPKVKASAVRSFNFVGLPDPADPNIPGTYPKVPTGLYLTIAHDTRVARIVVTGGQPGSVISVRVLHG